MEGLPNNITYLEEPCTIYLLTKSNIITRVPTIDVSKFTPGFMLQTDFSLFNVESIHVFTSTFVVIFSYTVYPFGFTSIIKMSPMYTLKFRVTSLTNPGKKVAFIILDKYGALQISS